MAPPENRRSSYSRRAQYGIFTGYVLASLGALVGAILLGLSLWKPGSFSGPRGLARDAIEPATQTSAAARTESAGLFESIGGYLRAGSKNAALREEVELARIRLAEARAVEQENARLKTLLGFNESEVPPIAVTRFVGSSSASSRRFGYIGAGRADGVEVGMPVRSPRGIVGRVLEVGMSTSRVLLLTDSQSVLPVRLADAERDVVAFVEGRGDRLVRIRLINLGINPLEVGDMFVTSGTGGYYRPGTAVAIVTQITDDGAIGRIISDPAATDVVAVQPIWQAETVATARRPAEEPIEPADQP